MPSLPEPTPVQQDSLSRVAAAAERRAAADREYLASIVAAAAAGLTVTQIARATGTTYQAVQRLLKSAQSGPGPGRGARTDLLGDRSD